MEYAIIRTNTIISISNNRKVQYTYTTNAKKIQNTSTYNLNYFFRLLTYVLNNRQKRRLTTFTAKLSKKSKCLNTRSMKKQLTCDSHDRVLTDLK
jgi:hypothetical protein